MINMNIFLLSDSCEMANAWNILFEDEKNVEVVCDDFGEFMKSHNVECVVSPANSFGLMDGGYDAAIIEWFGDELQENVQKYILEKYFGEQPVGSSFIIDTPQKNVKLIHTPTMRVPEKIWDSSIIYNCMRTCLITALQNNIKTILIPAFGASAGRVHCKEVAEMMWHAFRQIFSQSKEISWEYAMATHYR